MLSYNAKLGLLLFVIYTILYGGFVLLNAFAASVMESEPIEGLNLAIIYGFALILGAFLMALLYGFMCRDEEDLSAESPSDAADAVTKEGGK